MTKKRVARRPSPSHNYKAAVEPLALVKVFKCFWTRDAGKVLTVVVFTIAALLGCNIGATAPPSDESRKPGLQTPDSASPRMISLRTLPAGVTGQMVEQGRIVFQDRGRCSRCHGRNGGGTLFGPALNRESHIDLQTASYQEILELIRSGVPRPRRYLVAMPPSGSLSNDEIRAVAAYVFSISKPPKSANLKASH
jgi:mono/diheme cytochrome c family protein